MELFLTPLSATFLPFTLKLNHRLFQKIIGITLISHQAFASSASVLTTQHYIIQLSNIINEEANLSPFIAGMRSVRLGRTVILVLPCKKKSLFSGYRTAKVDGDLIWFFPFRKP